MPVRKIVKKINKQEKKETLTAPEKLKVLFTIIERNKTEFYLDILDSQFDITLQCVIFGRGTAQHLGLGDTNKAIIMSIVKEEKIKEILSTLEERFNKTKYGKGIAYTIPITSVIGVLVYQFLSNNNEQKKENNNGTSIWNNLLYR